MPANGGESGRFPKKRVSKTLGADKASVKAAGDRRVRGAFDDGAAVREKGHLVIVAPEFQHEVIVFHAAMWREPRVHLREGDGPMALVDLNRVASAERDVRASVAGKMRELTPL